MDAIQLIVFVAVTVVPLVAAGGLRRWPWRYAFLAALGWLVVLVAGRLTIEDVDPGLLVWAGAAVAHLRPLVRNVANVSVPADRPRSLPVGLLRADAGPEPDRWDLIPPPSNPGSAGKHFVAIRPHVATGALGGASVLLN